MKELFKIKGFFPYTLLIFLNAFIDIGHKIVIQNAIFKIYDGQQQIILTAIVNALILLPFILLFTPAGFISDKYPKNLVMRFSALAAIILTGFITLFYHLGLFWPAFAMTLLMAVQSAIFSPSKYGFIKELVGKERLAQANGIVQATTTISILASTFVFSIIFEMYLKGTDYQDSTSLLLKSIAAIGWLLMFGATIELLTAYSLPQKQPIDKSMLFDWRKYRKGIYLYNNINTVIHHKVIILSIIGLAVFWSIGQVLLAAYPAFVKENLDIMNTAIVQGIMACAGIGIMMGSLIAGRLSRDHIETGLIPIGSFGIAICLFILPDLESTVSQILNFLLIGMFGGLFIIPLNALIQFHASEHELGRILAGNNFIQNISMLSFLVLTVIFAMAGLNSKMIFFIMMVVAVFGAIYTLYKLPQSLGRFLVSFMLGQHFKLKVNGMKNIPESGGVLMLGNHISWIDWALIQTASPRPVHFVMQRLAYPKWYIKRFLDLFGVISIDNNVKKHPVKIIAQLLSNGEVVCLFPEENNFATEQLSELLQIYKNSVKSSGIVLPFYIKGFWGKRFLSFNDKPTPAGKARGKNNIEISFAAPLKMDIAAEQLWEQIYELSEKTVVPES